MPPEVAQAMSRSQMVNTARPIDQYRSLQPSDVSFSRGASAPVNPQNLFLILATLRLSLMRQVLLLLLNV
jgi:hypothetical protein